MQHAACRELRLGTNLVSILHIYTAMASTYIAKETNDRICLGGGKELANK